MPVLFVVSMALVVVWLVVVSVLAIAVLAIGVVTVVPVGVASDNVVLVVGLTFKVNGTENVKTQLLRE